jgi:hypothetical protein
MEKWVNLLNGSIFLKFSLELSLLLLLSLPTGLAAAKVDQYAS